MSAPTAGYLETGVTVSLSGSLTIKLRSIGVYGAEPLAVSASGVLSDFVWIGITTDLSFINCGDWDSANNVSLYTRKASESFAARTTESTVAGGCPQPYLSVAVTYTATGLRLVGTVNVSGGGVTSIQYRLWADSGTTFTLTVGSKTITSTGTGLLYGQPGIAVLHYQVPIGFTAADLTDGVLLENATWNTEADPTTSDTRLLRGRTGGSITPIWTYTTLPPLHYTADVDVRDAGGSQPAHNLLVGGALPADYTTVANGSSTAITKWRVASTFVQAVLDGDWSTTGVDPPTADRAVPLRQLMPKAPGSAPQSWTPTTVEITSPLSVLRSANTFSAAGSIALSGTGNQTWTVTGAGSVTRTLLEYWRAWNTPASPRYQAGDDYTTTKHDHYSDSPESDVWGWGLYAYLDVDLTAPGNDTITLSITWAIAGGSLDQTTKTYTISATTGRHTYRVDLLFPQEGGPFYGERVDSVAFSGLVNGVWQLHGLDLVADEDAYVKVHADSLYTGLTISQDGQFGMAFWGNNPLIAAGPARWKDDESGYFTNPGPPPNSSFGGSVRMDGTMTAMATELARMEGVTVAHSESAINSALTDGVNTISLTRSARWYHTLMGARAAPNTPLDLDASIYADGGVDLCAAPAGTFVLPFRHTLGMMLEAQAVQSGGRAAAGSTVHARVVGVGTSLGSALTDASGFVEVPIPTGTISGSSFAVALGD